MTKLATITIFAICLINLVPAIFRQSEYCDNIYNTILYSLFSFLGLSFPFMVSELNLTIKRVSCLIGAWCMAGLIFELINFSMPEIVLNSFDNDQYYVKFLIAFTIGIAFIITSDVWTKQKR